MNPTKYGDCQFDAAAHPQRMSFGIYRMTHQMCRCAVEHLRENEDIYCELVPGFNQYLLKMSRDFT